MRCNAARTQERIHRMEERSTCSLAQMAADAGLPRKPLYTLTEIARATGIPRTNLVEAVARGDLASFMPPGRRKGRLVECAWFDEWFARGVSGGRP